ncbi:MAG: ABC transporter ATP-binding protein [Polyangiaceae bacterium]|jgi:ABC-type multidrug transport system fused ATPase/permease subunit
MTHASWLGRILPPPPPLTTEVPETLPRSIFRLFWLFARPYGTTVVLMTVASVSLRALSVLQFYATKRIVDTAARSDLHAPGAWNGLVRPLLGFFAILAVSIVVEWGAWFCSYSSRIPVLARARQLVFTYAQRHSPTYFDNMLTGKVAHRAMLLPEQTVTLFERTNWDYLPLTVQCCLLLVLFFRAKPAFALVLLAWLVVYIAITIVMGRKIAALGAAHSEAKAQLTGRIVDSITNIKNVIFFAAHEKEDRIVGHSVADTFEAQRAQYRSFVHMRLILQALNVVIYAVLLPLALDHLIRGTISVGDFLLITTLMIQLIRNVFEMANGLPDTYDMIGSIRDSLDMLIVPRDIRDRAGATGLKVTRGEIVFDKVHFLYDPKRPVFRGLDLMIKPGERVGLIGHSGAGKSTLATLLMRLYESQSGSITIDGQNIADVTQESLRRSIGLIPQDAVLFHRTLMENIRYGRPQAGDAEVFLAARRAHAHEFIMTLPLAYDTLVGERGVKLSGGQRQRIAIARALLKDAPILILDEATSALDSESEALIQSAMAEAMVGKTVIAIAHRLSTLAHLDRLIVLDKGRIVEDGSHAELMLRGGVYASLWARQVGGFLVDDESARTATIAV